MSDLAIECNRLSELNPQDPQTEALRLSLKEVTESSENLRNDATHKHGLLRSALRDTERKQGQLTDYRQSVADLAAWIDEAQKSMRADEGGKGPAERKTKPKSLKEVLRELKDRLDDRHMLNAQGLVRDSI